ncbi:MAG TPA: glycosyltransferase [Flavisolibacter sp.]|nr:glycosyltransferase [Flavisolibacter sp.]
MQYITILCPIYNDQSSFNNFAAAVEEQLLNQEGYTFSFLVVNDGSDSVPELKTTIPLRIIHLNRNIGHQKAITIGLSYIQQHFQQDKIVIMDCDGEDKPGDIMTLVRGSDSNNDKIIFAQRKARHGTQMFKLFYVLYKVLFRLLTGKRISFGNFMVIPNAQLKKIVYYSEIWNHVAGGILKIKVPYATVPLSRGKRYKGISKMSFTSLCLHGLGAIGVFLDVIATRLILLSAILIGFSIIAILIVTYIRFFTTAAIPGWATGVVSAMMIVLLQGFLLSLFTIFLYLSFQSQRRFIPAHHYMDYVLTVENPIHG